MTKIYFYYGLRSLILRFPFCPVCGTDDRFFAVCRFLKWTGNMLSSSASSVHSLNSINSKRIYLFLCLKNGRMERIAIKQTTLLKSNNEVINSFSFRRSTCFSMEFAGNIEEISHQLKNKFQIILCNNNPTTPHPFYDKFATHLELISNQTENTLNVNFIIYFHHGIIKSDISLSKTSSLELYGMVLTPLLGPSVCLVEHKTLKNSNNSKNIDSEHFNIIHTVEPWHMDLDLCNTSDDTVEDSNNTNNENKTHKEPLIKFKINLLLSSISPVNPLISLINASQPINSQSNDDNIDVLHSIEVGNSHKIADGEYRISLFLDDLSKIPYDAPDLSYDISHEGRKHMVQCISISLIIVNGVMSMLDKHDSTDVSDDSFSADQHNNSSITITDNKEGIAAGTVTPTQVDSLTSNLAKNTISASTDTNKTKLRSFHRTESIRAIPKANLGADVILNIPSSPTAQTVNDITNSSAGTMTNSTNSGNITTDNKSSFKFDKSKLHNISSNEIIPASEIVHNNSNNDSFYQVNTSSNKTTKQTKESSLSTAALSKQALYLKEEAEKLNCLFESNDGAATTAALRSTDSPYAVLVDSDSSESEDSTDRNIRDEIIALEAYIPKILRNQIISQITLKCIDTLMEENEIRFENYNSSSIERFHGALLFVDISGFTLLSLCMNVESFKNCINKYFTTMLDVVKQFEGEVVKFAGDALFILWQTTAVDNESEFNQAAFIAANNALSCGLKINEVCNNYPVYYDDINNPLCAAAGGDRSGFNSARGNGGVHNARGLGPDYSGTSGVSSGVNNGTSNSASDMLNNQGKSLVHLNVHSGVSIGILAGIDVGDSERWEYFLVGDPLTEALHAEKLATAGTIVASTSIYNILHPNKHVIPSLSPQPSMNMRSIQTAIEKSAVAVTAAEPDAYNSESSGGSNVRRTSKPDIPTLSLLAVKNNSNNSNNSDGSDSNSLSPVGSQLSSNNTSNISISSVNSMSAVHLQTNSHIHHNSTSRSNSFSKTNTQTSSKQNSSSSPKKMANNFNFVPLFQCSNESMSMENPADSRDGYYKVVMKKSTFHKSNYLDSIHSPKMIKRHNSGSKNSSSNSNIHNASGNNYRRSFSFDSPSANAAKFDEIINLSSKIIAKTASNNSTPLASNRNSIMTYNNSNNNSDYGSNFNSHNASRNVSRNSSFKVQNSTFQNTIINSSNSNNNSGNNSGGNSGGNSGQNSAHASNNTSFTLHNLLQHNSLHDFEEVGDTSPIPVPVRRSSFKNQKVHSNSQIIAAIEENQSRRNSNVDGANSTITQSNVAVTTSIQPNKSKLSMLFGTASSSDDSADQSPSYTSKKTTNGTAITTHTSTLQPYPVSVNSAVNQSLAVSTSPPKHLEIDSEVFKALDRDLFYAANLPEDVHNIPENIKLQIIGAIERHVHEVVRSSLVLTSHMLEHYHTNHSGSSRSSGGSNGSNGSSFNSGGNSSSSYSNSSSSGSDSKRGSSHSSSNHSINSNDSVTKYRNKKSQSNTAKQHNNSDSDSESSYDNSDIENEDIFTYSKSNSQKHSGKDDAKPLQPTADTSDYSLSETLKTDKHKKTQRTENTENTVEIESDSDLESYHSSSSEEEKNHKKHRKHDKKSKKNPQNKRKSSFSNSKSEFSTMDSILTAELRQVVVLFIKIDLDCQLSFSESTKIHSNIKPIFTSDLSKYEVADLIVPNIPELNFLARTQEEYNTDLMLLETLQVCFSIIARAFRGKNGQIRQFIVDDKGTVCIGSFGLRGSTTENDSATAAQVANNILKELQSIGLNASIGITTGKAYCGLVGSPERHEYAIMGPSTNLSARLCCAAARKVGTILCDSDTKEHDRFHYYSLASSVQAKGYSTPVATFIPIFPNSQLDLSAGVHHHNSKQHHKTAHNAHINGSSNNNRNAMVTIDSNQNVLYDIEYLQESFPEEELSAAGNLESRKKNTHRSYFLDESIPVQNIPGKLRAMSDSTFATFENNSTNNNHNNTQHAQLTLEQEVQNEIANIHGRTKDCDAVIKFIYPPIVTVSDSNGSGSNSGVVGTNGVKNAIINNNVNNQIDKESSNSSSSNNLKRNKSVNNINSIQNNNISNLSLRSNNSSNFSMIFPNNNAYNTSSWGQNKLKIVVFEGSSGVGLSSMLDLTCHKIHTTIKNKQKISPMHSINNNIANNSSSNSNSSSEDTVIYFTQSNTVDTNSQFLVWKSIFIQLFIHLFKVIPEIEQNALLNVPLTSQNHNEMVHTTDKTVSETDDKPQTYAPLHTETDGNPVICAVLAHILSSLPKEYTTLKPLLNGYLLPKLGHENSATAPLFGVTRARKLMEFLSVILQQCVNLLNKNVIIAIDDLQSMDSRSWWLLRYMWEHNTGIVVIASFRTENTLVYNNSTNNLNNINNTSGNNNNANMSQLDIETEQTFTDPTRVKRIVIKPLDKINMSFFVCSMLKIDPFLPENDEISDKIFDLSGGNPLYANELIKTLLLKTGFSNNSNDNSNSSDVITDNNTAMNSNITQMLTPSAIRRKSFNLLRNSFIKPITAANTENDSFTSISNNTDNSSNNNINKGLQLPLRNNSFTRASPLVLPSTPRRSFIHPGPNSNTSNPNGNDFSDHENQLNEQLKSKLYCEIIRSLKPNHRIEEVIYYKFDRLSSELQLIIKIACVAGMNGFQFTAKMIEFMLPLATQSEALNEKVKRKSFLKNGSNNSNNNSSSSISSKLNLSRQNSNNNMQNSDIQNNIHNASSSISRRRKSGSSISIHSNSNNDSFYSKQTTPCKHSTSGDHMSENLDHGVNTLTADSIVSSPKTSSPIVSTQTVKSALRRRTVGSVHNLSALDMNLIHDISNSNSDNNTNSNSISNSSGVDDILSPYYIGKSYNSPLSTTSIGNNKSDHNSSNHSLIYSSNNSTLSPTPINSVSNSTRKQRSTSFHNTVTDADDYTSVASPAYGTTRSRRSTSFHTDLDEDESTSVHSPAYGTTRTRRSTSFHTEIDDANGNTSVLKPANDVQIKIPLSPQISPKSLNTTPTNTNTITKRKSFTKQNSNNNMSLSDIHSVLGSNSNNTSMHNLNANNNNNTETKLNVAQLLQTLLDQNIFLVDARQSSGMREIRKSMMKFNKIGLQYEDIINEIDKINHSPRLDSPKSLSSPKSNPKSTSKSSVAAVPEEQQDEKRLQFHSTLVQSTIYEMMLETQKIYFHERLALFLEKQQIEQQYISESLAQFNNNSNDVNNSHTVSNANSNSKNDSNNESVYRINSISDLNLSINTKNNTTVPNTVNRSAESVSASASDLTIQGLHWERAMVWRKAMNCYYHAGKILQDQGASNDSQQQLISAYWMFCEMRRSAGLNFHTKSDVNSNYNPFNSSLSGAVSGNSGGFGAKNTTNMTNNGVNTHSQPTSQQTSAQQSLQDELVALSQDDVARIFNGVVSDFEIAINMLVKLAQCLLAMNERADVIASLYFEALQLVMTTRVNGAAPLEEQLVSESESGVQQTSTNSAVTSIDNVDAKTNSNGNKDNNGSDINNTSSNNINNLLLKSALKSKSSSDKEYSGSDRELSGIMTSNHSRPRSNTEVETIAVNSNNNSPSKVKRRKSHSRETSGTPLQNSNGSTILDTNNTNNNTNNNRPSTPTNSAILTPSRRTLSRKRFSLSLFFPGQQQQYETDSNSSTDSLTSVMLSTHRNSYFTLANYNTIFPILSGLIILYGLSFISESNNSSSNSNISQNGGKMSLSASNKTKKKNIVKLFLSLTRNTGSSESSVPHTIGSNDISVHHLRALTCQAWYFFDSTRYVEMLECTDTILSLYSFDTHHLELIKVYGADRILHTIALAAKCSLCLGRVVKAGQYIDIVQKLLKSVTHLNTVAITTMPMVDTLLLFGCSVRCNEVFLHYTAVELQWTGYYSLLQPSNPFFAELIDKKIELETYNSNTIVDINVNNGNSNSDIAATTTEAATAESPYNSPRSPPISPRATSVLVYETLLTVLDTEQQCVTNDTESMEKPDAGDEPTLPATAVPSVAAVAVQESEDINKQVLQEGETTLRILRKYARGMETVQAELCLVKVKELYAALGTINSSNSICNDSNTSGGISISVNCGDSSNDVSQQPLSVAARLFATDTNTADSASGVVDGTVTNIVTPDKATQQQYKQQIVDYCTAGLIILNQVFNSVPNYSVLFPYDTIYGLWTKSELTPHSALTSSDVSELTAGYEKALACLAECEIICDSVKSIFHKLITCKVKYTVICTYEQMLQHRTTSKDDIVSSNNSCHYTGCDETIVNSIKTSKQKCLAQLSSLYSELMEVNAGADNVGEMEVFKHCPVLKEIKDLLISEAALI